MIPAPLRSALLCLMLLLCRSGMAETRSRWGFEIKNFKLPNSSSFGDMIGFRNAAYFGKSQFSFGIELSVGAAQILSISNENHVYNGGFTLGTDATIIGALMYELNLFTGYSEAVVTSLSARATGIIVEPSLGLGFVLGNGWRISFRAGYVHMPGYREFNGFNFGLRLDRKTSTTVKPENE